MNLIKKLAATALLSVSLLAMGCGNGQVASVDVSKVMENAPRVKTLMDEAETKAKAVQADFEKEYANKPDLTQEEVAKAQMDLQRKLQGINQAYTSQIKNRLDVVLEEIAREKNLDVVISNSAQDKMIFHGAIDVTDDVIKKMQ
ncbi:MAG: OmpH family outer membrane protein [Selenomonadaceae bacterium]|nr:OmpH family outer membrane protein [Selenomonadaceae bacterium]MBR4384194.1 OmpH family outer membrane protein [Selenomonadaceae bacterium]